MAKNSKIAKDYRRACRAMIRAAERLKTTGENLCEEGLIDEDDIMVFTGPPNPPGNDFD